MVNSYGKINKYCATCACWMGVREVDTFGQRTLVAKPEVKGKCASPQGPWKNIQKAATQGCNKWEKWAVLK